MTDGIALEMFAVLLFSSLIISNFKSFFFVSHSEKLSHVFAWIFLSLCWRVHLLYQSIFAQDLLASFVAFVFRYPRNRRLLFSSYSSDHLQYFWSSKRYLVHANLIRMHATCRRPHEVICFFRTNVGTFFKIWNIKLLDKCFKLIGMVCPLKILSLVILLHEQRLVSLISWKSFFWGG